jgi:ribonuclease PH
VIETRTRRGNLEMRPLALERGAAPYAEGSCLIALGNTRVLCAASVEQGVPAWRRGSGKGWLTAEYSMLPRATHQRTNRERGQLGGRTQEIQRLIGRSLRSSVDLSALGEWTIRLDCDVLQADGGTRTAAITGAAVALADACRWLEGHAALPASPFRHLVAAVSLGLVDGELLLDLEYAEDSRADLDLNLVAVESGALVELQGTAEGEPFDPALVARMLEIGSVGILRLVEAQRAALA